MNAVAFSENSSVLASASYDRSVALWDCKAHTFKPIQVREDTGWRVLGRGSLTFRALGPSRS